MNTSRGTLIGAISAGAFMAALFVAAVAAPQVAGASCVYPGTATNGAAPAPAHPNDCEGQGGGCDSADDCCAGYDCQGGSCCIPSGQGCGENGFGCCSRQCLNNNTCS